jgi:hypothetical protein
MEPESELEQKRKYWDSLRSAIVHEDNLVNHRLTWTLTIEGFLVAGFFVVQKSVLANELSPGRALVIELLLAAAFTLAICICWNSGSMIAAAFKQISLIRAAWTKRYPAEKRGVLEPVPNWFLGSLASPEDAAGKESGAPTGPGAAEAQHPEFPPLMGEFRQSFLQRPEHIASLLIFFNAVAIAGCVVILFFVALLGADRSCQDAKFEIEKATPATRVKATFDHRPSPNEMDELKLLLQALEAKQP